jgi:hypothetical protein
MPSLRRPRLSEMTICSMYLAGRPRAHICLAAGVYDAELVALLKRNGVPLRSDAEAREIAIANRERWKSTGRARIRHRK